MGTPRNSICGLTRVLKLLGTETHSKPCKGEVEPTQFPEMTMVKCDKCLSTNYIGKGGKPLVCHQMTCQETGWAKMRPVKIATRRRLIERFIRESERCIAS